MTFENAIAFADAIVKENPFQNKDLRAFVVAAKCILKSVETGKGRGLIPRMLKTVNDFAFDCEDLTGAVKVIAETAFDAARKV